jgi:GntR family transcriptional regulator, transcriptional repressor for pyruvate dehydrogenase complex
MLYSVLHSRSAEEEIGMFETLTREPTLTQRAREHLEKLILDGSLGPGDRLPSENDIGEKFGVSRTVIRQAIHLLAAKGLVESRPGSGTYVRQFGLEMVKDPIYMLLQANILNVHHISETREILEITIAGLSAARANPGEIEEMRQSLSALRKRRITATEFAKADVAFHVSLAEGAHNPLLLALVNSLNDLMLELRLRAFRLPGIIDEAVTHHSCIFEYVRDHDAVGARKAMEQHLKQSRENLERIWQAPA